MYTISSTKMLIFLQECHCLRKNAATPEVTPPNSSDAESYPGSSSPPPTQPHTTTIGAYQILELEPLSSPSCLFHTRPSSSWTSLHRMHLLFHISQRLNS